MRKLLWLLLLLSGCTGSSEPPLSGLLAVASGTQLVLYVASSLQPESTTPFNGPLATWTLPAPIQDLLVAQGGQTLWVLTSNEVLSYPLGGLSLTSAPQPAPITSLNPPSSCSGGYLRGGIASFLVVCPSSTGTTLELVSYAQPSTPTPIPAEGLLPGQTSFTPLPPDTRYALGPNDGLLYASSQDAVLGYDPTPTNPNPSNPANLSLSFSGGTPQDLVDLNGTVQILATSSTSATLDTWNVTSSPPSSASIPLLPLASPPTHIDPGGVLVGGTGFFLESGSSLNSPPANSPLANFTFTAGLVSPDQFLYLVGPSGITCVDLEVPNFASSQTNPLPSGASPVALAFFTVS